jgi:Fic family protein
VFIFELIGSEQHPAYQRLSIENLDRQYSFLRSAVLASMELNRPMLSVEVIKALNYHAISCLHSNAGQLRPCHVTVGNDYAPPPPWEVPARMEMFVDEVNRHWDSADPVYLASFVLWKLNWIHPFINGNGRTARVTAYLVLCLKAGQWLPGDTLLPELIRQNRDEYVLALKAADASLPTGQLDLTVLHGLLTRLLSQQLPPEPVAPV